MAAQLNKISTNRAFAESWQPLHDASFVGGLKADWMLLMERSMKMGVWTERLILGKNSKTHTWPRFQNKT